MSLRLVENPKPDMMIMEMKCDKQLHKKLDAYELTKFLNKHSANIFLGKPSQGKTTFLLGLFDDLLKRVYHNIYLFQPPHSRNSMKRDIFADLPDEKKFDELTYENLSDVLETIKDDDSDYNHCIIFDDMTAYLKSNVQLELLLKDMINNRRHYHITIYFLVQTLKSIPMEVRRLLENLFVFKVNDDTMNDVFNDYLREINKNTKHKIIETVYDKKFNFLFVNVETGRLFKNWDEIIYST